MSLRVAVLALVVSCSALAQPTPAAGLPPPTQLELRSAAKATLEQQAAGELTLVKGGASSPLPGPLPVLGLDLRL